MKLTYRSVLATAVSFLFVPASLFAASLAFDSASDPAYGGVWTNGSNGGTGWNGGWAMFIGTTLSNTPTAQFIGSSTNNDINGDTNGDGDIDTSGKSWGLLGNGQDVFAERLLTGALNVGQKIVISMDNGVVPTNDPNAEVGVLLQNDLNETRLQFKMGSTTNIYDLEHIGPATGITNTDQGLMIEVEVVTIDTAKVSVTTLGDGVTHVFSNILMNAGVTSGHHQINYVVLENKSTGGGVTNQSFFNSMYVLPDTNDSTFFADQSLGMAASANPAIVNSNLTYTITVTNKGPSVATSMTVTDVPPSGVTFVSATSAQGTCTTDAFGRVICTVGSLASNGVASIALVVTPLASGVITNIASASALNVDPNPGDNVLTNIASVVTAMQLSVTPASFEFGTIATGTTQQTSFVVTNLGGATLTGTATVSTATFAVVSGSPFSIVGFGTTNVGVSFTPSSTGSFTDNVVFASDGGVSTNTVTGTGAVVPVASFTGAPRAGLVPLLVTFTNSSTGTITNRFWNFGDSGTTNTSNPTVAHTYNSTGTDTVTLIVSGPLGVSTNTQLGYITVTNIPPVQTVTPASHDFGLLAVGQSSTQTFSVINGGVDALIGTATVSGVQFVLVGGSPYNVSGGQTGSVTVSFDPNSAGSFTGSVAFASNGGDSTNTVTGSAAIAPVADFTASATNGFAPLSVTFTDTSTGTITNHSWTFGDGGTSTASSPSHTYTNAGSVLGEPDRGRSVGRVHDQPRKPDRGDKRAARGEFHRQPHERCRAVDRDLYGHLNRHDHQSFMDVWRWRYEYGQQPVPYLHECRDLLGRAHGAWSRRLVHDESGKPDYGDQRAAEGELHGQPRKRRRAVDRDLYGHVDGHDHESFVDIWRRWHEHCEQPGPYLHECGDVLGKLDRGRSAGIVHHESRELDHRDE